MLPTIKPKDVISFKNSNTPGENPDHIDRSSDSSTDAYRPETSAIGKRTIPAKTEKIAPDVPSQFPELHRSNLEPTDQAVL